MGREKMTAQSARFADTARALGADENEAAFRAKLAVIARQRPTATLPEPPEGLPEEDSVTEPKRR